MISNSIIRLTFLTLILIGLIYCILRLNSFLRFPDLNAKIVNNNELYNKIINDPFSNYSERSKVAVKFAELAESSIETIRQTSVGVARLWVLAAKARIEMDDISTAKEYCKKCLAILETTPDAETKCMVLNTLAIVSIVSRDTAVGWNYLHQSAEVASSLSNEYRLLTITNIALLLQKTRPQEAVRYKKAAKALCKSLHFSRFALEAFE